MSIAAQLRSTMLGAIAEVCACACLFTPRVFFYIYLASLRGLDFSCLLLGSHLSIFLIAGSSRAYLLAPKMPPKQQGKGGKGQAQSGASGSRQKGGNQAQNSNEAPQEDPLVAVILADSFDSHYAPLTIDTPRCLLPLAGVPLIDYSIEAAAIAGAQHVYVLSCAHSTQIKRYVTDELDAKLHLKMQGVGVTVMSTPEARSTGDVMRELDAKQVLRSDFLLFQPDCVTNLDLRSAVQRHKERRKVDKDAIMTMCASRVNERSSNRSKAERVIHYVDASTNQVLHYEMQYPHTSQPDTRATLPGELLQFDDKSGHADIDIRTDLIGAGVDICSIDVPPLFSENFDYQSLPLDFIPGILTSDLLDSKIFVEIKSDAYSARAKDTVTYDAVAQDVLRRWTSPMAPGSSAWIGGMYAEKPGWRYIGEGVKMDRSVSLGNNVMVGGKTSIGSASSVSRSTLGSGVVVGTSTSISGSHLFDSVKIGSNCQIEQSIIGQGAQILDGVTLERGCLIGGGCVVGPNVKLVAGTRVGRRSLKDLEEDEWESEQTTEPEHTSSNAALGAKAVGHLWPNLISKQDGGAVQEESEADESEAEEEDEEEDLATRRVRALGYEESRQHDDDDDDSDDESISSIEGDSELEDSDDDDTKSIVSSTISGVGNLNLTLDDTADTAAEQAQRKSQLHEFKNEAVASLTRAFDEGHTTDNAAIELKTLRMASNVPLAEVRRIVIEFLLQRCNANKPKEVEGLLNRWGPLLANVAADDQIEALVMVQSYCATHANSHGPLFVPLLKKFYNDDVVSDENIVAWWRAKESRTGSEKMLELRQRAEGVVRYILEDDDDDDDEDDDDE